MITYTCTIRSSVSRLFLALVLVFTLSPVEMRTPPPVVDGKDFFQVTDELGKENSHFMVSEALLAVIEQVREGRGGKGGREGGGRRGEGGRRKGERREGGRRALHHPKSGRVVLYCSSYFRRLSFDVDKKYVRNEFKSFGLFRITSILLFSGKSLQGVREGGDL